MKRVYSNMECLSEEGPRRPPCSLNPKSATATDMELHSYASKIACKQMYFNVYDGIAYPIIS
ncbi:unnamed protein product [Clavelina lepadiformis]|uniref:Uncharacterized protein n=1 Tax=Clavelina lepadiformis TaxID=159417 RepID=A0ABP0G7T6_CLALP